MIVKVRFDLTDADRRRLTGSQRLATRKQVAELARRLLAEAMNPAEASVVNTRVDHAAIASARRLAREAAAPDARCVHCNQEKTEHGHSAYSCPLDKGKYHKTTFTPAVESPVGD